MVTGIQTADLTRTAPGTGHKPGTRQGFLETGDSRSTVFSYDLNISTTKTAAKQ